MYTSIPITIKSLSTATLCLQSTYSNKKPLATLKNAPGNKLFRNLLASAPKTKQGTCKHARVCIPHTDSCIHGKRWLNSCNKCFKYQYVPHLSSICQGTFTGEEKLKTKPTDHQLDTLKTKPTDRQLDTSVFFVKKRTATANPKIARGTRNCKILMRNSELLSGLYVACLAGAYVGFDGNEAGSTSPT